MLGDLNCRSGNSDNLISVQDDDSETQIPPRQSKDLITSSNFYLFSEFMSTNNLFIINGRYSPDDCGEYTHHSSTGSVIDYALMSLNLANLICKFEVIPTFVSDHSIICLQLALYHSLEESGNEKAHYAPVVQLGVLTNLVETDAFLGIRELLEVQSDTTELLDRLLYVVNHSTTWKCHRSTRTNKTVFFFDSECRQFRSLLNRYRRLYRKNPHMYLHKLCNAKRHYRHLLRKKKKQCQFNIIDKICQNPNSIWSFRSTSVKRSECIPGIKSFFQYFRSLYYDDTRDMTLATLVDTNISDDQSLVESSLLRTITIEEVAGLLKKCSVKSAAGSDNISYTIIRIIHEKMPFYLPMLFNSIIKTQVYPAGWKTALITPVFKKGDPTVASNYRPIMLQSCIAKLFSRILEARLRSWLCRFSPLYDAQFGFRPGYSTVDAALLFHITIAFNIEKKNIEPFAALIDFSSAFDSINRKMLIEKLLLRGVPVKFCNIIISMYSDTLAQVKLPNGNLSDLIHCNKGVRQGDPLSPLLFCLYIDDLIPFLEKSLLGLPLVNKSLLGILYADDLVLFGDSSLNLTKALKLLEKYADMNCLLINPSKTQIIRFRHNHRDMSVNTNIFTVCGKQISCSDKVRYLGLDINTTLSNNDMLNNAIRKTRQSIGMLHNLFPFSHLLPLKSLKTLYYSYVISMLSYGAPIWASRLSTLPDFDCIFLKTIFRLPQNTSHALIKKEFFLDSPKLCLLIHQYKYLCKLSNSNNMYLKDVCEILLFFPSLYANPLKALKKQLIELNLCHLLCTSPLPFQSINLVYYHLCREARLTNEANIITKYCYSHFLGNTFTNYSLQYFFLGHSHRRTMLLIRTNSLLKSIEYKLGYSCIGCGQLFTRCESLLLHIILSCEDIKLDLEIPGVSLDEIINTFNCNFSYFPDLSIPCTILDFCKLVSDTYAAVLTDWER